MVFPLWHKVAGAPDKGVKRILEDARLAGVPCPHVV